MYILNQSHLPTARLQPLVDFVTQFSFAHNTVYLHLVKGRGGQITTGFANYLWTDAHVYGVSGRVVLKLSHDLAYPTSTQHRKSLPIVDVKDFEEEFVLVLAHELRHIDQSWSLKKPKQIEVDAERFAIAVLDHFRATRVAPVIPAIPEAA